MSQHLSPVDLEALRTFGFVGYNQFVMYESKMTYAEYYSSMTIEVGHLLTNLQRMENIDLFGVSALRSGITPVVITSAEEASCDPHSPLEGVTVYASLLRLRRVVEPESRFMTLSTSNYISMWWRYHMEATLELGRGPVGMAFDPRQPVVAAGASYWG
ncbi:hypothetical protein GIB67_025160 [Kingdonia uniflora]|uniref:Uncharacterized protein n=1 Tax=Kingdonia uniflora TaxID=39325 RepID=A0A7J7N838_9MAGN|nr:hypothetical protein GIB67_025160 [Kingdonia uniflora]